MCGYRTLNFQTRYPKHTYFLFGLMLYNALGYMGLDLVISELCFKVTILHRNCLRKKFNYWSVHGIMNTSGLLQRKRSPKGFALTLQETGSIHDSMNRPKMEFITYIYIYRIPKY